MKQLPKRFLDCRLQWPKGNCIHCGDRLNEANKSREHIPSKSLLKKPYPDALMTMQACPECNSLFALDEEYLSTLLAALFAASTDPQMQGSTEDARRLKSQPRLKTRIERSRARTTNLFGEMETVFLPELERIERVVIKNARGHALYELDRWMDAMPISVVALPIQNLSEANQDRFESISREPLPVGWPEVGTRMFMRLSYSFDPSYRDIQGSWIVIQENYYRYWVEDFGDCLSVKSVIREYLATEVIWSD